jgi:hypothetical protein
MKMKISMKKMAALAATVLVCVLAIPIAALADDTVVTGEVPDAIAVTAPGTFAMDLDPSDSQPVTSTAKTVHVDANGDLTWNLKAAGSDAGKMASTTASDTLDAAMVLSAAGGAGDVSLTGTAQDIYAAHAAGSADISTTFKQTVSYLDPVAADYSITVTFTESITP